ncbi:MAG: 2-oxoacid:acceptor oxidoreductase subunit alpha [Methanosarcinales archaeon]|nr:2-oxoacid:acceptor oxidoreductase subunit alpha [Methanosarcinales archaeon]
MDSFSVLIGGRAGDGINEAGMLIAQMLNQLGYRLYQYYDYPSLIRGGHNFSIVRAAREMIGAHLDSMDVIIALNQETVSLHRARMKEESILIFDSNQVKEEGGMGIPVGRIMKEEHAPPIMRNTCILGAFCRAAGIPWEVLEKVVKSRIPRMVEMNLQVARRGYDAAREAVRVPDLGREPLPIITGNEAVGLGLLKGGLKAYVAYPMTPSSSILHFLASVAPDFQLKVVHPENEIAVMLMALGFSYAGERSAVGTSGGGFCLMTEGLSLAGQAELPVTIVVSQRTGPSTGVPTYTAQSDLHFILNAGQGEFPRLVVAPGDPLECYDWSALALHLSWKYQIPSFVLLDKTLSEGAYSMDPRASLVGEELAGEELTGDHLAGEEGQPAAWEGRGEPYRRYQITESGVSPLLWPPVPGAAVKVDSYSHDQMGITTEDGATVAAMQEKRMRKEGHLQEDLAGYQTVRVYGDADSPTALLCWGSNKWPCIEAASALGQKVIVPVVLWPFPDRQLAAALDGVERMISVENNITGQLARLLRCRDLEVQDLVLKYDGRPFAVNELEMRLREVLS